MILPVSNIVPFLHHKKKQEEENKKKEQAKDFKKIIQDTYNKSEEAKE